MSMFCFSMGIFAEKLDMYQSICKYIFFSLFFFLLAKTSAQKKFNPGIEDIAFILDNKTLTGYSTVFDFRREEVRRGWWKYARQFSHPLNMRTFYQMKIPSEVNEGNVDLFIFTQIVDEGGATIFKIGQEDGKYLSQVRHMLREFKRNFYIAHYLDELALLALEAELLSNEYERAPESHKEELLGKMQKRQDKTEEIWINIKKVGSY